MLQKILYVYPRNSSDVFWEAISNHQVLSLYQGLGTKNLQSVIFLFIYFYGYSFFKKLYLKRSGSKSIGTKANLVLAAAAGACTVVVTQVLNSLGDNKFHMRESTLTTLDAWLAAVHLDKMCLTSLLL